MAKLIERLKAGLRATRAALLKGLHGTPEEFEAALLSADVGVPLTEYLLSRVRTAPNRTTALKQEIISLLQTRAQEHKTQATSPNFAGSDPARVGPWQSAVRSPKSVVMLVGVNGSGKTTTVGKLAHIFRQEGKSVVVAASDTYRDAAAPQLRVWADRAGVEIVFSERGQDAAAVAYDALMRAQARGSDLVLVDTAGRLHTRRDLMDEARKIKRVISRLRPGAPDEIWLVLDATVGQNGISQARSFDQELGLTGLIVTKLDGTAKGGVLLPVVAELKLPVRYIGVGEELEDLQPFSAQEFAEALL